MRYSAYIKACYWLEVLWQCGQDSLLICTAYYLCTVVRVACVCVALMLVADVLLQFATRCIIV